MTLGGNYGWRIWKGTRCTGNDPGLCNPAGFKFPITEYGHTGGRCSVTGGYAYRGANAVLPYGTYIYGDYCTGEIFSFYNGTASLLMDSAQSISSFGEDEAGELYVVNFWGDIYRIAAVYTRPGTATLVAPFGQLSAGATPTFTWNAVANATYYTCGSTTALPRRVSLNGGPTSTPGVFPDPEHARPRLVSH